MLDLNEINSEILRLENGKTTYSAIEKLALLYTVRNQLEGPDEPVEEVEAKYSMAVAPQSEFLSAISDAPLDGVFDILDEHMGVIKLIYPKEYDMILKKIKNL